MTRSGTRRRARVLFRVDAGVSAGFGHLRRTHALATALAREDVGSAFVLREAGPGWDWLVAHGESPAILPVHDDEASWLADWALAHGTEVVALDVATPVERRFVMTLRDAGRSVMLIDNDGPGRLVADLCVSPAAPASQSWQGAHGTHVASPAYAILAEPFHRILGRERTPPRVLVAAGGSDPDGMTFAAVDALDEIRTPIRPVLVVGPGFRRRDELHHRLASAAHAYEVHHDAREMVPIVATATVAVAAFGTSAYELAAARVPAVLIPRRAEDRWHAERFEAAGAAIVAEREPRAIAAALGSLIDDAELRRRLALGGERLVDGRGAERVAALVRELLPRTSRRARGVHGREGERAAAS